MAISKVKGVGPDDTLRKALALMDEFNVDQVPYLGDDQVLLGVVTRRRLTLVREDFGEVFVRDIKWTPHRDGLLRSSDTPLDEVFYDLFNYDFVLISEDGEKITGIVTINDVAKCLYQQQASSRLSRFIRPLLALRRNAPPSGG